MKNNTLIIRRILWVFTVLLTINTSLYGQNTFEDLEGRFVIDLPEGFTLDPQENDNVFVYRKEKESLVLFVREDNDHSFESMYSFTKGALKSTNFKNLYPYTEGEAFKLHSNPAKWAVFKSDIKSTENDVEIALNVYQLIGSIVLNEKVIVFSRSLADSSVGKNDDKTDDKIKEKIAAFKKTFLSLRLPGEGIAAPTAIEKIDLSDVVSKNINTSKSVKTTRLEGPSFEWKHLKTNFIFPFGWELNRDQEKTSKFHIATFKNNHHKSSILLFCFKGILFNRGLVTETFEKEYGKSAVAYKIPDKKIKANIVSSEETQVFEGKEIKVYTSSIIFKKGKCTYVIQGVYNEFGSDDFIGDLDQILQSI